MSFLSHLGSFVRSLARHPQVRSAAKRLGRDAVREVQRRAQQSGSSSASASRGAQHRGLTDDVETRGLPDRDSMPPVVMTYAPHADGHPDPGEVVWGWVPFEENQSQGKDRPVLVLAEENGAQGLVLIALMLTSKDRADGATVTDKHGNTWVDIGTGDWDSQGRASEVRADRLLRLDPRAVRREGGRVSKSVFDHVTREVAQVHGWS